MDQAQRAQGFDEVQLARLEFAETFISCQQVGQLPHHLAPFAREQHPQVLYGRAAAAVVEIDEVRAGIGPQDVADMAIAMQAQGADLPARS
jgi:hypothetical protein